ncbi:Tubulin tyrosine ligase [Spironucleus salmonicida]|uniref:Tubulin tyrosine ligase n=1 Tax=Spironucleus salmonicida TaxID=348837 RepID=V6LNH4_9EUKA|nr:Tubulin tyrosine ligase [Spironucleus salmonicida]|eukprot:EST45788.1 Tubulin tyrosine ligase [Spironucleus salmonicida]
MEELGEYSNDNHVDKVRLHQQETQVVQKVLKKYRVRACLEQCKYTVVHDLSEERKWKECTEADDWNLCWNDWSILVERVMRMKAYQKINHYPGMSEITRKDTLARNMNRARKLCPDDYDFFPQSFQIPSDVTDFKFYHQQKKDKKMVFISKPNASCQGRGIKLFRNIENVDLSEPQVIQEYITKPYLINGIKFDLRTYVIVIQVVPTLQMIYYEDGMARFCTEPYQEPNSKNLKKAFMHLTNYAINKNNDNFEFNDDEEVDDAGSKWGLSAIWQKMEEDGIDVQVFKEKMFAVMIKTVIGILPNLQHAYSSARPTQPRFGDQNPYDNQEPYFGSSCFEILGFDIMIDQNNNPILIEVNHSPSFRCDTPLDLRIKQNLISGVLDMLDIQQDDKILFQKIEKVNSMKRLYGKQHDKIKAQQAESKPKSKITKKSTGLKTIKQMPTYSSVQQHIFQFLQKNQDTFKQIYPPPINFKDPYEAIIYKIKYPKGNQQDQQHQPSSIARQPLVRKQSAQMLEKVLPRGIGSRTQQLSNVQSRTIIQSVEPSSRPASQSSRPQSVKQRIPSQTSQGSSVVQSEVEESFKEKPIEIEKEDPMQAILRKALYEIEYGIDTKQIAFRGVHGPVLLPQGALRNEKIEKTVEQDLNSKLRAMLKFGIRDLTETIIRIGQRAQNQNQMPQPPQRVDVFQVLQNNNRSKSITNAIKKSTVQTKPSNYSNNRYK